MSEKPLDKIAEASGLGDPPANGPAAFRSARLRFPVEYGDILVCLAFLAMAGWFYVSAAAIPDYSGTMVGPDDFPRGLAVIFAGFVLALLVRAVFVLKAARPRETESDWVHVERPLRVVAGMALLVVFPFLMEHFGFYLTMAFWMPAFFIVADYTRLTTIVVGTGGFILFTKLVFEMLLGTPIP